MACKTGVSEGVTHENSEGRGEETPPDVSAARIGKIVSDLEDSKVPANGKRGK